LSWPDAYAPNGAFMGWDEGLDTRTGVQTKIHAGFLDFTFTGAALLPSLLIWNGH